MLRQKDGVDKIQKEKKHLNFDDLNEIFSNSNNRLILIVGNPGGYCVASNYYTVIYVDIALYAYVFCIATQSEIHIILLQYLHGYLE